jgi:hypothetical protein
MPIRRGGGWIHQARPTIGTVAEPQRQWTTSCRTSTSINGHARSNGSRAEFFSNLLQANRLILEMLQLTLFLGLDETEHLNGRKQ